MTVLPAHLWAWLPQISESELKVWLYLLAHLPPGTKGAGIPLRTIEQGTGLARSSVMRGQAGLRAKGIVQGEDRSGNATRYCWPASPPAPANGSVHPAQIAPIAPAMVADGYRNLRPLKSATVDRGQAGAIAGIGAKDVTNCAPHAESNRIVTDQKFKKLTDSIPGTVGAKPDGLDAATTKLPATVADLSPRSAIAYSPAEQLAGLTAQLHPGASPTERRANTTRLLRLYERANQPAAEFAACIDTAAARTQTRLSKPDVRPLACPISYFFTVLERLLVDPAPTGPRPRRAKSASASTNVTLCPVAQPPPGRDVAAAPAARAMAPVAVPHDLLPALPPMGAESVRLWQAVLVYLRASVPADAYGRVVRYAVALDLRRDQDRAVIGVPAAYMQVELSGALAPALAWALGQVCGRAMRVQVTVLTGRNGIAA